MRSITCGDDGQAAIGERRIGAGEFEQRDFRGAERDRGVRLQLRGDAEPVRGAHDRGRRRIRA